MLGKLIKHEFRAASRFLLPIHLLLIAACFIGRFVFQMSLSYDLPNFVLIIFIIFYVSVLIIVPFITQILIVIRYYKNLYTDEGYLTFTLPATRGQLLFSKGLIAFVWSLLDFIAVVIGSAILILIPTITDNSNEILASMEVALGMDPVLFFWATLAMGVVSFLGSIALYYFCISLGQLLSSHRVLGAFIAYFALSNIISIVSLIFVIGIGLNPFDVTPDPNRFILLSYKVSTIMCLIEAILFFGGTYYLLKKKTNLN